MEIADLRFLVVEDHNFQRWFMGNLLTEVGAKSVLLAGDGSVALELLRAPDPVDVVITDLDMPRMDGMEFIRHMAQRDHAASLIVVSSLDPSLVATVEAMALEYGVRFLGAIQKPLTAMKLRAVLGLRRTTAREPKREQPAALFTKEEIAEGLRRNEFEVFFQPKVEMMSRKTVGAEALARWRHPTKGLIYPDLFIDLVESGGMMDAFTQRIAREAARNCRAWIDAGSEVTVSINISPSSLLDLSLADRMVALVKEASLEPRCMTLEITESVAAAELGKELENLSRLRMKGFGLSIDDFGTGHSSMERLSRIPFTELKIDQGFVRNATRRASRRAMVESSLELARKLGIDAVAEGVDNRSDWELLLALGCTLAQGYYLAMPMDAAAFTKWLLARRQEIA